MDSKMDPPMNSFIQPDLYTNSSMLAQADHYRPLQMSRNRYRSSNGQDVGHREVFGYLEPYHQMQAECRQAQQSSTQSMGTEQVFCNYHGNGFMINSQEVREFYQSQQALTSVLNEPNSNESTQYQHYNLSTNDAQTWHGQFENNTYNEPTNRFNYYHQHNHNNNHHHHHHHHHHQQQQQQQHHQHQHNHHSYYENRQNSNPFLEEQTPQENQYSMSKPQVTSNEQTPIQYVSPQTLEDPSVSIDQTRFSTDNERYLSASYNEQIHLTNTIMGCASSYHHYQNNINYNPEGSMTVNNRNNSQNLVINTQYSSTTNETITHNRAMLNQGIVDISNSFDQTNLATSTPTSCVSSSGSSTSSSSCYKRPTSSATRLPISLSKTKVGESLIVSKSSTTTSGTTTTNNKSCQRNSNSKTSSSVSSSSTPINCDIGSGKNSHKTNQCNVCGRNYARPSTLKTHLRTHTNERPFKCSVCEKTFSQAANLTAHQRVHTGERPFSCPTCGRQFSQSSSVITHLRTHSGERPYRCNMCHRTFSDSSTLTKHCRIHSGEKPYQCDFCPLNFSQSGNLSRHLKLHMNNNNNFNYANFKGATVNGTSNGNGNRKSAC